MNVNSFRLDKRNAKVLGVCAGIANATGIDATWVRVGFVGATLLGSGIPALGYIIVALIVPSDATVAD